MLTNEIKQFKQEKVGLQDRVKTEQSKAKDLDSAFKVEVSHLTELKISLSNQLNLKNEEIQKKDSRIKDIEINFHELKKSKSENRVKCDVCQEELVSYSNIKHHIINECNDMSSDEDDDILKCENCEYTTLSENCLKLHKNAYH